MGISFMVYSPALTAQDYSEKDARTMIGSVEEKLNSIQKSDDAGNYSEEISKIKEHFNLSLKYLDKKKYNMAYYNARMADTYFTLIDTKREYREANENYGNSKD